MNGRNCVTLSPDVHGYNRQPNVTFNVALITFKTFQILKIAPTQMRGQKTWKK